MDFPFVDWKVIAILMIAVVFTVSYFIHRRTCQKCNKVGLRKTGRSRIYEGKDEVEFECSYCGSKEWRPKYGDVDLSEERRINKLKQVGNQFGAEFTKESSRRYIVRKRHKKWTITLLSETGEEGEDILRMRVSYLNKDGFGFVIYPKHFLSGLAKPFQARRVDVGVPDFDRGFIVKGNDPTKVRALFANPRIRQLIQAQPKFYWFGASSPEGFDELYFRPEGSTLDLGQIKSLFELFTETLNQLVVIGSASEESPNIVISHEGSWRLPESQ